MAFVFNTFANQGNILVAPPQGVTTPASQLDENFANAALLINETNYPIDSSAALQLGAIATNNGAAKIDFSNVTVMTSFGLTLVGEASAGSALSLLGAADNALSNVSYLTSFGISLISAGGAAGALALVGGAAQTFSNVTQGQILNSVSGSNPILSRFGTPTLGVATSGNQNNAIFYAVNNLAPSTSAFPAAVTAYVEVDQDGNAGNGLYVEAHAKANSVLQAVEADPFNDTTLAPDTSPTPFTGIGSTLPVPIGITIAADSTLSNGGQSSLAIRIAKGGINARTFANGISVIKGAVTGACFYVDGDASTGAQNPVFINTPGRSSDLAFTIQNQGATVATRTVAQILNATAAVQMTIRQNGAVIVGANANVPTADFGALIVTGNANLRTVPNVAAEFGVTADPTTGAVLQVGSFAGATPFVGAGLNNGAASNLALVAGGTIQQTISVIRTLMAAPVGMATYTVATLPTGAPGDTAYATDCRVFNGAGTLEGAGVGSGGLVTKGASAWRICGTNITAQA